MNVNVIRITLILLGILAFAYSLNTGTDWIRWVAIALVASAIALRLVQRVMNRR